MLSIYSLYEIYCEHCFKVYCTCYERSLFLLNIHKNKFSYGLIFPSHTFEDSTIMNMFLITANFTRETIILRFI
jgi:hypothetical protein